MLLLIKHIKLLGIYISKECFPGNILETFTLFIIYCQFCTLSCRISTFPHINSLTA